MKTGAKRECPDRESKPGAQHPHRTHRTHDTTDQWRETILVARPKAGSFSFSPSTVTDLRPELLASFCFFFFFFPFLQGHIEVFLWTCLSALIEQLVL